MSDKRDSQAAVTIAMTKLGNEVRESVVSYFSPLKAIAKDIAKSVRDSDAHDINNKSEKR